MGLFLLFWISLNFRPRLEALGWIWDPENKKYVLWRNSKIFTGTHPFSSRPCFQNSTLTWKISTKLCMVFRYGDGVLEDHETYFLPGIVVFKVFHTRVRVGGRYVHAWNSRRRQDYLNLIDISVLNAQYLILLEIQSPSESLAPVLGQLSI